VFGDIGNSLIFSNPPLDGAVSEGENNEKKCIIINTYGANQLTPFAPSLLKRGGWGVS
jgi:hypothetical protein